MFSLPPRGTTAYIAYRSVQYMDFARVTITRDIFIPGPTQCGLSRTLTNRQNTQHFTSLMRELAFPSTGSWLPSRLSSTWRWKERIECIFSNSKYVKKKTGHFKWKAGKQDGAKKAWVYTRKRYCWHLCCYSEHAQWQPQLRQDCLIDNSNISRLVDYGSSVYLKKCIPDKKIQMLKPQLRIIFSLE